VKNLLNPIQKIEKGYEWYKLELEREKNEKNHRFERKKNERRHNLRTKEEERREEDCDVNKD
jgi:hypothetical protein